MYLMSRLLKIFLFIFIFSLICFQPVSAQFVPQNSPSYLTDYLETDVFLKLSPKIMQDRYKNAMILRAGPNPNPETIKNLYGFTPATIQVHDYTVGNLKLSQLQPKPLDDPQALALWEQSATAKVWKDVPMFTREDTKGWIEAPPNTSPAVSKVIHPHLARTYEVSSALGLLTPYQKEPKPMAKSGSQSVSKFLTGTGDQAQDSIFTTIVSQTINNPYYDPKASAIVTDKCGTHSACEKCDPKKPDGIDDSGCYVTATGATIPSVTFKTYTPFLNEIRHNLIGIQTGAFNIFNLGRPFSQDLPALGRDAKTAANPTKFYYPLLGSTDCARQKVLSFLQPFTGQTIALDPLCQTKPINIGSCDGADFAKLNPPSTTTSEALQYFTTYILPNLTPDLITVYSQASAETEVPCEVLAAIHFMEGSNNPNQSLISGRPLGTPEPDAGNKVFQTLLETATYAGNELKQKINNDLTTMEKLITALSRYNGGGNANCRFSYSCNLANNSAVPSCPVDHCCNLTCRESCAQTYNHTVNDFVYPIPSISFCPRQYEGEDDPYSTNMYNNSHLSMYLLYCLDRTMCTPQLFTRPGAAAVSVEFYNYNINQ